MDLRFQWLRCREAHNQFQYYWDPGLLNWGEYSTKHHTPTYREQNHALHARTSH